MNPKQSLRALTKQRQKELWEAAQEHSKQKMRKGEGSLEERETFRKAAKGNAKLAAVRLARLALIQKAHPSRKTGLLKKLTEEAEAAAEVGLRASRRGRK